MSAIKYDDVSIFYDKSRNRYYTKVTIEKGKRKTIYGKTEEEVLLKARKLLYSSKNTDVLVSVGTTIPDLLKLLLERKDKAGKVGNAQYTRTLYVIKDVERFKLGNLNIRDITENNLQDFFDEFAKKYSNSSIDKCYSAINEALIYAKKKNFIKYNPLEEIIKSKSQKADKEITPLTIEEQKIFTHYLKSLTLEDYKFKNVFLIQMYAGLRIGEVLALKTSDIDLKNNKIHIQRTLTTDRNNKIIIGNTPKTNAGNRIIPIPDIISPYIKEQLEVGKNNFENLLFTNNDKLVRHSNMNDQLKRRLVNLGIYNNGLTTHSLRHTYATRCIEGGMQAIVLSKLLGHSDIRITLNTYVKVFNEYQTKSTKEIEEYYKEIELAQNQINSNTLEIQKLKDENSKIIQFPFKNTDNFYTR